MPNRALGTNDFDAAEKERLLSYCNQQFELGFPLRRTDYRDLATSIQRERFILTNEFNDEILIEPLHNKFPQQIVKFTPGLSMDSDIGLMYPTAQVSRTEFNDFFKSLWAIRSKFSLSQDKVFYLSFSRFYIRTEGKAVPPIEAIPEDQKLSVLDSYNGRGDRQKKPVFIRYGGIPGTPKTQENGVIVVPHSFTKDDMLRLWFDIHFADNKEQRVILVEETRVCQFNELKKYCLTYNVHILGIPRRLCPFFAKLDFALGKLLREFVAFSTCCNEPVTPEWFKEYTKKRNKCFQQQKIQWSALGIIASPTCAESVDAAYALVPPGEKLNDQCVAGDSHAATPATTDGSLESDITEREWKSESEDVESSTDIDMLD